MGNSSPVLLTVLTAAAMAPSAHAASIDLTPPDGLISALVAQPALPAKSADAPREQLGRVGPASYDDGVGALAGGTRPNARTLSNRLSVPSQVLPVTGGLTNLGVAYFQFIASHEIAHTLTGEIPESAPIPVLPGDPLFQAGLYESVPFSRSNFDAGTGTDADNPRQQVNQITKAFDASTVYGSTSARETALRDPDVPYLLKMGPGGGLISDANGRPLAGDGRADENPVLEALHALFMREHNRQASAIASACKPDCSDQQVYDAARTLVSRMQHKIFYDEALPALLGTEDLVSLLPDPSILDGKAPQVFSEFTAAAGRLHSMVPDTIETAAPGGPVTSTPLAECFFARVRGGSCTAGASEAEKLYGAFLQPGEPFDTNVVDGLRNAQVPGPADAFVIDLNATNIARGRDHGLPSYTALREALGFAPVPLDTLLPDAVLAAYGPGSDIDLYIGLLAEMRAPGALVGPTSAALWALQFELIRDLVYALPDGTGTLLMASLDDGPMGALPADAAGAAALLEEWLAGVSMAGLLSRDTGYDLSLWGTSPFRSDTQLNAIPVPPAIAGLVAALLALVGIGRRRRATAA